MSRGGSLTSAAAGPAPSTSAALAARLSSSPAAWRCGASSARCTAAADEGQGMGKGTAVVQ